MSVRYVPVALGSVEMSARALVANRPLAFPTAAVSVVAIPALILVASVGNSDLLATMLVFIDARLGIPHLSMPFLVSTGAAFG
jgi:hypothetical protein